MSATLKSQCFSSLAVGSIKKRFINHFISLLSMQLAISILAAIVNISVTQQQHQYHHPPVRIRCLCTWLRKIVARANYNWNFLKDTTVCALPRSYRSRERVETSWRMRNMTLIQSIMRNYTQLWSGDSVLCARSSHSRKRQPREVQSFHFSLYLSRVSC